MTDWRTYDRVADTYERVHAPRFAEPARDLVELAEIGHGDRVLDLGTGTGVAAEAAMNAGGIVAGIDESIGMLRVARRERPKVPVVAATALDLPFGPGRFDVVIGSFVLAHFTKVDTALHDVLRVLRPGGRIAMSVWADSQNDAFQQAWEELVTAIVPPRLLSSAVHEAAPGRDRFARREVLQEALYDAGIRNVRLERRRYRWIYPLDDYVEGLGVWATGRFARDMLGEPGMGGLPPAGP